MADMVRGMTHEEASVCSQFDLAARNSKSNITSRSLSHRAPFIGFWFRGAMERDDLGDGAQTQPLAASGSGCFVVAQSLAACLVLDEEPSAASVGELMLLWMS